MGRGFLVCGVWCAMVWEHGVVYVVCTPRVAPRDSAARRAVSWGRDIGMAGGRWPVAE